MDIKKHDLAPLSAALSSEFSVYAVDIENPGSEELTMDPFRDLMVEIDKSLHDNEIDLNSDDFRLYLSNKDAIPTSFYQFGTHVLAGAMPFLFYRGSDGGVLGCLLKIEYHEKVYDPKVIKNRINAIVASTRPTANPISYKEAKKEVENEIRSGVNVDKLPILERRTTHYIYFDFEHQQILVKNSSRNSTLAHHAVLFCNKFAAALISKGFGSTALRLAAERNAQLQPQPTSYTTRSIQNGVTTHTYNMNNLVRVYATTEGKTPVQATDSADLRVVDKEKQKISLKHSLSVISHRDEGSEDQFQALLRFSKEKTCDVTTVTVTGEIPMPRLVKAYIEKFPEQVFDEINGDFFELTFLTKSVQGNITFAAKKGVTTLADLVERMIKDESGELGADFKFILTLCSKWFGDMLEVLHNSSNLFVQCYLDTSLKPQDEAQETA